jgi:long-chain acyl-CoA synthetase
LVDIITDDALALQRLYRWETTAPDRIALTQPTGGGAVRDYTWREVLAQSRRMAAHLITLGLLPGDRVAILSKNTAHWLMSDFAIWLAGGVSVPLYPTLAAGTIRQILEHSESRILFVGKLDGWAQAKAGIPTSLPCISHPLAPREAQESCRRWDDIIAKSDPLEGRPVRPAESLATIIYTSGTTGLPKGVMWSFAAFARQIQAYLRRVRADGDTRFFSYLPLSHIAERAMIEHVHLAVGGHTYFPDSAETFTADVQRARPTFFFSVPRLWVKFQHAVLAQKTPHGQILTALGLDQCSEALTAAAPMPAELLSWYAALGLHIRELYGMTEVGATHCTARTEEQFGTVGLPLDNVECRLDPLSGEIGIRSPWSMLGYYKSPELTLQTIVDGWVHTGDKGALDAHGNLMITGRVKDLFKTSKGEYVAPGPIEQKLVMHSAVEACCVMGANLPQPIGLTMLNEIAAKKSRDAAGRIELEASLADHLRAVNANLDPRERLDCLVVITESWTVGNDFVTPTMKIKRNRIEDTYASYCAGWTSVRKLVVWH